MSEKMTIQRIVTLVILIVIFMFNYTKSYTGELSSPLAPVPPVYSYAGIAVGPLFCGYDATFKRNIEFSTSPLNVLKKGRDAGISISAFFDNGLSKNTGVRFSFAYESQKLSNSYLGAAYHDAADSVNYPVSAEYVNTSDFFTGSVLARFDFLKIVRFKVGIFASFPISGAYQSESYFIHKSVKGGKDEILNFEGNNLDQVSYWGAELELGLFIRLKRHFVVSISCGYRSYFTKLPDYGGIDPWHDANARKWEHNLLYTDRSMFITPIRISFEKGFTLN